MKALQLIVKNTTFIIFERAIFGTMKSTESLFKHYRKVVRKERRVSNGLIKLIHQWE